jgi:hypothetical protein
MQNPARQQGQDARDNYFETDPALKNSSRRLDLDELGDLCLRDECHCELDREVRCRRVRADERDLTLGPEYLRRRA